MFYFFTLQFYGKIVEHSYDVFLLPGNMTDPIMLECVVYGVYDYDDIQRSFKSVSATVHATVEYIKHRYIDLQ